MSGRRKTLLAAAAVLAVVIAGGPRVLKLPKGAGKQQILPFSDLENPRDVAVDGGGNIYVSDDAAAHKRVGKLNAP